MTTIQIAKPTQVAKDVLDRLEAAWNAGDGRAFGACYAADASFVTIRGEHFIGSDVIGRGHQGIFDTIYAGSVNRMELVRTIELADGLIVAVSENTLDCPTGPLAGVHRAMSTSVLTRDPVDRGAWLVITTHNTLERS